jgi:hypothetical protein
MPFKPMPLWKWVREIEEDTRRLSDLLTMERASKLSAFPASWQIFLDKRETHEGHSGSGMATK